MSDLLDTDNLVYSTRIINFKFNQACRELININNLIEHTETRYNKALAENRRSFRYILRLKLSTLEAIRNMYYEYARGKADQLEENIRQIELQNPGIAWNIVEPPPVIE